MAVGAGVIDNNFEMVQAMGFPWIKLNVDWASNPDPSSLIDDAHRRYPGVKILLRIDNTPAGARTGNDADPIDAVQLDVFLRNLAARQRGKVHAYELFNEPNLKWEWNAHIAGGGGMPSVAGYARILQIAHPAIKAGDPSAIVVTGGLSTAGDGGSESIGDLHWIRGLYANGAMFSFDAMGTHPYGGACAYDAGGCDEDIFFRRAEQQYDAMRASGDVYHQMWATELGWLIDPRVYGKPECMAGLGGRAGWVRSRPTSPTSSTTPTATRRRAGRGWAACSSSTSTSRRPAGCRATTRSATRRAGTRSSARATCPRGRPPSRPTTRCCSSRATSG